MNANQHFPTIAIITCDRRPSYLTATLASLFASGAEIHAAGPVHILSGSRDGSHTDCLKHHHAVRVHPLGELEDDGAFDDGWYVHQKFAHNICRALLLSDAGGLLLFEDDVIAADHFWPALLATIAEMESHGLARYCLSLTSCGRHDRPEWIRGERYTEYPSFYGTQAMYYPASIVSDLRQFIWRDGVEKNRLPADLLIGERYADLLFCCWPHLADHIGDSSTGMSEGIHRSPVFGRPA